MGEGNGGRGGVERGDCCVEPRAGGVGDFGFVEIGTLRGIEANELPAGVMKCVVQFFGKGGIVSDAITGLNEIVVSRNRMNRDLELRESRTDDFILRGFATVGEVAGDEAEGGIGRAFLHFCDDCLEKRDAFRVECVQVIHGDKSEGVRAFRCDGKALQAESDDRRGSKAQSGPAGDGAGEFGGHGAQVPVAVRSR